MKLKIFDIFWYNLDIVMPLKSFESGKYNLILENFMIQIFKLSNSNYDWLQLSPFITRWICGKFHDVGGLSDLSKRVYKHKLRGKKITQKKFHHKYFAILNCP